MIGCTLGGKWRLRHDWGPWEDFTLVTNWTNLGEPAFTERTLMQRRRCKRCKLERRRRMGM